MANKKASSDEFSGPEPEREWARVPSRVDPEVSIPVGRVVKTVEAWALEKGCLPERLSSGEAGKAMFNSARAAVLIPGFGPRPNPEYWKYAGAKALCRWVEGAETTEAEFDDAIVRACSQRIG